MIRKRFCGSIIFQQIYNIADSLVAGKFIGENVLAAVHTAMISSAIVCSLLMVFGIMGSGMLLSMIHTPDNIEVASKFYTFGEIDRQKIDVSVIA